jgi:hypothetical protein
LWGFISTKVLIVKKLFMGLLALCCVAFFSSYCFADNYDKALKEIRAEKNIIYVTWGPAKESSLYVAVKDDGGRIEQDLHSIYA